MPVSQRRSKEVRSGVTDARPDPPRDWSFDPGSAAWVTC
jgi:hypothetical protein